MGDTLCLDGGDRNDTALVAQRLRARRADKTARPRALVEGEGRGLSSNFTKRVAGSTLKAGQGGPGPPGVNAESIMPAASRHSREGVHVHRGEHAPRQSR